MHKQCPLPPPGIGWTRAIDYQGPVHLHMTANLVGLLSSLCTPDMWVIYCLINLCLVTMLHPEWRFLFVLFAIAIPSHLPGAPVRVLLAWLCSQIPFSSCLWIQWLPIFCTICTCILTLITQPTFNSHIINKIHKMLTRFFNFNDTFSIEKHKLGTVRWDN